MRSLILLSLLSLSFAGSSQTGTYKKIMSEKASVDRETFFKMLREYQKDNTQFSNVYLQLGNVEMEIFSNLDPITDRVESRQRLLNVKTNYSLAVNYLDPKEISKFPEWYDLADSKNKDSLVSTGQKNLEDAYANVQKYIQEYESLIHNYDKAVSFYLTAREGFIEINNSAESLRQLFLEADEELKQKVREVGENFAECLKHIEWYRETYQVLPHKEKRKVNVNLRRIDHFRMNGITPVNFLADDINLWDYGQWSSDFLELLRVEVDGLQDEITSSYQQFASTSEKMIYGNDCLQAQLDDLKFQRIINLINKYDNNSVLGDIFRYMIAKLEYGNQYVYEQNCNVYEAAVTDDLVSRKARIYQNLFQKWLAADSLNEAISSSGNTEATFMWFFEKQMDGENGSQRFAESQKEENQTSFKNQIAQLRSTLSQQFFQSDSTLQECFEEQDNLLVQSTDTTLERVCIEKAQMINDTLSFLMARKGDQPVLIGAAPIELDYEKFWEITAPKGQGMDFFKIVGDSSFVLGGYGTKGWLGYYANSGTELMKVNLEKPDTIVNVNVNQLQGSVQVTQVSNGAYTISTLNFSGKLNNKMQVTLPGTYAGTFTQNQATYIYALAQENQINGVVVGADGNVAEEFSYQFEFSLDSPSIIKNDDQFITLVAKSKFDENDLVYALLNYNGEVTHEKIF